MLPPKKNPSATTVYECRPIIQYQQCTVIVYNKIMDSSALVIMFRIASSVKRDIGAHSSHTCIIMPDTRHTDAAVKLLIFINIELLYPLS